MEEQIGQINILYINGIVPTYDCPSTGIFVSQRIRALKKNNVNVYPIIYQRLFSPLLKIARRICGKPAFEEVASMQLAIKYVVIHVKQSLICELLSIILGIDILGNRLARSIIKQIKQIKDFNIIHAHWVIPAGKAAYVLWRKLNIPYVITCHGSDVNYDMMEPRNKKDFIKVLENASCVEFVSNKLCQTAIMNGYSGKNAVIVPNGFQSDVFYFKSTSNYIVKTIGFVGNLTSIKRADKLAEIICHIKELYADQFKVYIVGDGQLRKKLEQDLLGLPVTFFGTVSPEKVSELMREMEVLMLPSRNEGWPCVINEAAACGVPVIGSNVGGIPEAVNDPRFIVAEGKDFEYRFAQKVVEVLSQSLSYDRDALIKRGNLFTWENVQQQSIRNYTRLIRKK